MMKALSLWRPWPWCFFHAGKRIENRSWPPPKSIIGQWVAMHAANRFDDEAFVAMTRGDFGADATTADNPEKHPTGIVGAMFVERAFEFGVEAGAIINRTPMPLPEPLVHDRYAFGPWCWVTPKVVGLPAPIPCKGMQGLWAVPPEIEAVLRARIAEVHP